MIPLHHDSHYTFRFADDRIISRFHIEGVSAGRRVDVFRIDSWLQVLVGQRQEARSYHHMAHMLGDERLRTMLATLKASIGTAVEKMPTHKAFLDQYCALQERR